MRTLIDMANSFMPNHEKEYEATLFRDKAIKEKVEYNLEALARALSGSWKLEISTTTKEKPFSDTENIKIDSGRYVTITRNYTIRIKMREFSFYGNNMTEVWLKIIDFWAGNVTVHPCGGANM